MTTIARRGSVKKSLVHALVATLCVGSVSPALADIDELASDESQAGAPEPAAVMTDLTPALVTPIQTINWWVYLVPPRWKCKTGTGATCTATHLSNSYYRQIVFMSSGYTDSEGWDFWADFDTFIEKMGNSGTVWSTTKKDRILYVGYFTGGGALNTPTAAFGGAVLAHPIRDYALSASNDQVIAKINSIRSSEIPALKPFGVQLILNNFEDNITANAAPPNFLFANSNYGVAKMNRDDLKNGYIGAHELGHAALNFLDEYVEQGLENLNIRSFDAATPLVLFNGTWGGFVDAIADLFGVYDYNISEILAGNGNHNITLAKYPSTVHSPISPADVYDHEGGFFFGRGTFHARGNNLMNSNRVMRAGDDGFAYAHSTPQQKLINTAFGDAAYRANNRLRTAGPKDGWKLALGSSTTVLMYDGDKRNPFHKTQHYVVQVGWWERVWKTCWWTIVPYPCHDDIWKTAQKTVYPAHRSVDLKASSLYGLANLLQATLCGIGVTEIPKPDGTPFQLCVQPLSNVASAFLPTFKFYTPYEKTTVPASQWMTKYWWRFATHNGTTYSGYTGWSEFFRSF
jgi:hypothetical protein